MRSTVLDVQPKPQKDDPEDPSHWDRNPEGQVLNNVPVKFVMADGKTEMKNVSIQFAADGEHFQVVGQQGKVNCEPCRRKRNPPQPPQATLLDVQPRLQTDQPEDTKKWDRFPNLAHPGRGARSRAPMVQQKPGFTAVPKGLPRKDLGVQAQRPQQVVVQAANAQQAQVLAQRQLDAQRRQPQKKAAGPTPQQQADLAKQKSHQVKTSGKMVYTPGQRNVRFHN